MMVMSSGCNLNGMGPAQLIENNEEANEFGGYFIVNGNEKIVRLLVSQRRNYPMCYTRSNYARSGPNFSEHAINIRCVRPDQTSHSFTLHYLNNGDCMLRYEPSPSQPPPLNRSLSGFRSASSHTSFLSPLFFGPSSTRLTVRSTVCSFYLSHSLTPHPERVIEADTDNTFITDRVEMMLRESKKHSYYTRDEALAYIGSHFR